MKRSPGVSTGMAKANAYFTRAEVGARVDGNFVGIGSQGCQHTRTANDDRISCFADLVERHRSTALLSLRLGAVDLGIDQGVGEAEVVVPDVLLVANQVLRASLIASSSPHIGPTGEAGEGDIQIVRRPSHHPRCRCRDDLAGASPSFEVLTRPRDEVRDIDQSSIIG